MIKKDISNFANDVISERAKTAKILANKFPELAGLTYEEFLDNLPIELDFITSCEMYKEINNIKFKR